MPCVPCLARKVLCWMLGMFFLLGTAFLWFLGDDYYLGRHFTREDLTYPIILTDRHGEEIYRIFGAENREWIDLEDMSQDLVQATILAEDHRFYDHFGLDIWGMARAVWEDLKAWEFYQGGSTITQQLARKALLTDEKTFTRKLREMAIAIGMEQTKNKEEILEMYLNTVPYGPRIHGVALAAELYFGKNPDQLSMAESLVLASLPKDPVGFHYLDEAGRRDHFQSVVRKVSENQNWDTSYGQAMLREMMELRLDRFRKSWAEDDFQHWQFYVRDFLAHKGVDFSDYPNGLVIRTTIDAALQREMYQYLRKEVTQRLLQGHDADNVALLLLDHQTRGPLVWIGSSSFWEVSNDGQVDVLRSRRQVGSAMKPFIYASAMDRGYEPPTLLSDTPIVLRDSTYRVRNFDGRFWGRMMMSGALNASRNIPAIKAMYLAGGEDSVRGYLDYLFGMGLDRAYPHDDFGWSLALGGAPVRLADVGNGYATLATGKSTPLCPILSIRDLRGREARPLCEGSDHLYMSDKTSFFLQEMLSSGRGRPWSWSWNLIPTDYPGIGVKTGTSSRKVGSIFVPNDNVVAGFTPKASMLLWAGNTDGRPLRSGSLALETIGPSWKAMMERFLDKYPSYYATFEMPKSLEGKLKKVRGEWASKEYRDKAYPEIYRVGLYDYGEWLNNPSYKPMAIDNSQQTIDNSLDSDLKKKGQKPIAKGQKPATGSTVPVLKKTEFYRDPIREIRERR